MKRITILFIISLAPIINLWAQQGVTLFQMQDVVQSAAINPAVAPPTTVVVGLAPFADKSFALSSPLSYHNIATGNKTINTDEILSLLNETNSASAKAGINLLTVGFRVKASYWQFSINQKISAHTSFSKDIVDVLLRGNGNHIGEHVEGKIAFSEMSYTELALGYNRDLGNGLRLGIRPKLLLGNQGVQSTDNTLGVYTDARNYNVTLSTRLDAKVSMPGEVRYNENGEVDDIDAGDFSASDYLRSKNMGFAADLGVVKDWDAGWRLSASLLDLGMVKWKSNTHHLYQNTEVLYEGASIRGGIDSWRAFSDTLQSMVNFRHKGSESFTQRLSPIAMLGASYAVLPKLRLGATAMTEFRTGGANPWALSATAFTEHLSLVSFGLSYTIASNAKVNLGAVMAFHLGPVELYAASDNMLTAIRPFEQRNANLSFGMLFRFGNKPYKWKQIQEAKEAKMKETEGQIIE